MPKKNGFFYFMLEYRKQANAKGRKFHNLGEVSPLAGKIWEKMDRKQREPYVQQAKCGDKKQDGPRYSKTPPETYVKQEKMDEGEERADLIITRIKKQLWEAELLEDKGLDKVDFYIISMVHFCRSDKGTYIPAELGVVLFNLECGVKEQLHILINPGSIPLGSAFDAQTHSKETHGLPLPPNALGLSDYEEITKKLLTFLKVEQDIPPLFTDAKDIPMVESMLRDILGHHINGKDLYVSAVAKLFFELKLAAEYHMMSMTCFPSIEAAQAIIDNDEFSHTLNISCEYHESCGETMVCALSKCIRWTYSIANNCCKEMAIIPIPGKHIPVDFKSDTPESLLEQSIDMNNEVKVMDSGDLSVISQMRKLGDERFADCETDHSLKSKPDLDELLKQQATGETDIRRVNLHKPQILEKDEYRRGMESLLRDSEMPILNVRGRCRSRGIGFDDPSPSVTGRGHGSIIRRGAYYDPRRRGR
uniref:HMG box domain-containing protein n=1 Tax=Anopheles minimus TaxID=112268 RepID=A0A182W4I5_9DIPT